LVSGMGGGGQGMVLRSGIDPVEGSLERTNTTGHNPGCGFLRGGDEKLLQWPAV